MYAIVEQNVGQNGASVKMGAILVDGICSSPGTREAQKYPSLSRTWRWMAPTRRQSSSWVYVLCTFCSAIKLIINIIISIR